MDEFRYAIYRWMVTVARHKNSCSHYSCCFQRIRRLLTTDSKKCDLVARQSFGGSVGIDKRADAFGILDDRTSQLTIANAGRSTLKLGLIEEEVILARAEQNHHSTES